MQTQSTSYSAIGGGLGLAISADFRVTCPEGRFSANFTRLGFHPGFGLTYTLPRLIGTQKANLLFLTGRRIGGEQAHEWGLVDKLVSQETLRAEAIAFAAEIAENAPLALKSVRATMRQGIADTVRRQTAHGRRASPDVRPTHLERGDGLSSPCVVHY